MGNKCWKYTHPTTWTIWLDNVPRCRALRLQTQSMPGWVTGLPPTTLSRGHLDRNSRLIQTEIVFSCWVRPKGLDVSCADSSLRVRHVSQIYHGRGRSVLLPFISLMASPFHVPLPILQSPGFLSAARNDDKTKTRGAPAQGGILCFPRFLSRYRRRARREARRLFSASRAAPMMDKCSFQSEGALRARAHYSASGLGN